MVLWNWIVVILTKLLKKLEKVTEQFSSYMNSSSKTTIRTTPTRTEHIPKAQLSSEVKK